MADSPTTKHIEDRFCHAFHRTVLARYKCSLDLYSIREDDCGGWLQRTGNLDPDIEPGDPQFFEIRYGFRHLSDGRICVVAWLPDIEKLSTREREAWAIDAIRGQSFAAVDPTYDRWKARTLEGEWNEA